MDNRTLAPGKDDAHLKNGLHSRFGGIHFLQVQIFKENGEYFLEGGFAFHLGAAQLLSVRLCPIQTRIDPLSDDETFELGEHITHLKNGPP